MPSSDKKKSHSHSKKQKTDSKKKSAPEPSQHEYYFCSTEGEANTVYYPEDGEVDWTQGQWTTQDTDAQGACSTTDFAHIGSQFS